MITNSGQTYIQTQVEAQDAVRPIRKRQVPRSAVTGASVFVILLVWEVVGQHLPPLFASYPTAIAGSFVNMTRTGTLPTAFAESIQPFVVGYLLAAVVGIPLGLVIGRYRLVEAALGIYITAGYAVPLVALIPLLVLWLGLGFAVKVAIIFLMAVFPIVINTWDGVKAVPKTMVEVGTAFCATQAAIMRKIIVPATIPFVMTGLRLAVGRAVVAMVVAEFLTAVSGLGAIVINAGNNFDTNAMFVPIIVLMILGVGLTWLVGHLERWVAPWQEGTTSREQ